MEMNKVENLSGAEQIIFFWNVPHLKLMSLSVT